MRRTTTRSNGRSRSSSSWLRRHATGEFLACEAVHLQLSSEASNLQPHILLSEGVLVGCGVSEVEVNQFVECPVQMDVLHVRRVLRGQRQASQMPFQFGELRQIRQRRSRRMLPKVSRETVAV